MCSRGDDPSMHDANHCASCCGGPHFRSDHVFEGIFADECEANHHNHSDHEHFVSGCPRCEEDTASAEASDHRRERSL